MISGTCDHEPLVRESDRSLGEHHDGRRPSAAWSAESHGSGVAEPKRAARTRPPDNRLSCFFSPVALDSNTGLRICGLSASPGPDHSRHCVPGSRAVALSPVTRGSRLELVAYTGGAREPPTHHARCLSGGSPPDVPGPAHLLRWPSTGSSQLGGGPVLWRCHGSTHRPPPET
jgi:hypothetical protein